jgi:uncharacterized RDD family membrane protein YckC
MAFFVLVISIWLHVRTRPNLKSKKSMSAKKIAVIAFIVPVLGILSEIFSVRFDNIEREISALICPLSLPLFNMFEDDLYTKVDFFNMLFFILLLLGAILFSISRGREARLIRFVFAAILVNKSLSVLNTIVSTLLSKMLTKGQGDSMSFLIIYFCSRICWIWLSYSVLIFFKKKKELEVTTNAYDEGASEAFVSASTGIRFLNFIMDSLLSILIYAWVFELLYRYAFIHYFLNNSRDTTIEMFLLLSIIICRTLYYVSFEFIFGATPSKLLTGTRVVDVDNQDPKFRTILDRTLARFVPFEAFSFFSGGNGWHDKWSKTYVVEEKSTDVEPLF